ncbi:MAG: glycosyltransferase family 4 protein [bacterium]
MNHETEKNNKREKILHGLVVVNHLKTPLLGMNRSIVITEPYLRMRGIHLHFMAVSSLYRFSLSVLKIFLKEKHFQFDFVIFNSLSSLNHFGPFGYPLARFILTLRIPLFIYWHETAWAFKRMGKEHPRYAAKVDRIASDDRVIHLTVSHACSLCIRKHYPDSKLIKIYNATFIPKIFDKPLTPSCPPIVVNIASIQERKGTDLFVKTAIKVCNKHPTVKFIWIGDGEKFGTWKDEIEMAGLQQRILFPGFIASPYQLLSHSSIFFLSSRDDPFPLSVQEAMCLGRTIAAFDVGGTPEALGGLGILIKPFDTDEAAYKILKCLGKSPEKLINHALRNRYYNLYTAEHLAARMSKVIRSHIY